ncbi:DUF5719 family protein [Agromyces sp. MMS24-JH15]|uniref:DUF5719 family protein n=1 Tax=Agromyces sp. MMS24-JH15 TaxID=3243765 RepID=UPI0037498152
MTTRRRALTATARAVGVLAVLGVGAALVAASITPDRPERVAEPDSVLVSPAASIQQRVCPGPLLQIGDDSQSATAASSFGPTQLTTAVLPADVEVEQVPIEAPDNPLASDDGGPVSLEAPADAVEVGLLAGAQSQSAATETLAGLAVAGCREPLDDAWLVGGSTALGRTTLILLANPTDVASTVDLRIFGETGAVDAPGGLGLVVPAHTQRVVSLAGLAPDLASPVVHVTSTGGRIAATLEQSAIDGLVPVGVELVGAAAPPADEQRIAGFAVVATADAVIDPDHSEGDGFPVLRLLAPGEDPVAVSVAVVPEGIGEGTTIEVSLEPGQVLDVPLSDLAPGDYAVDVMADAPVVAAARSTVPPIAPDADATALDSAAQGEPGDLAWYPASGPLIGDVAVAVPDAPSPMLHLTSSGQAATVIVVSGGAEDRVEVAAGGSASIAVEPGAALTLRGVEGLHATITVGDGQLLAAMPIEPPGPLDAPIRVYPR